MRKKITNIRKHAKEILTERIEGTIEHLMKADQKISALRVRTKKSVEIKAEMDRLRFEQVNLVKYCLFHIVCQSLVSI